VHLSLLSPSYADPARNFRGPWQLQTRILPPSHRRGIADSKETLRARRLILTPDLDIAKRSGAQATPSQQNDILFKTYRLTAFF